MPWNQPLVLESVRLRSYLNPKPSEGNNGASVELPFIPRSRFLKLRILRVAPKGHNMTAQGNALGTRENTSYAALKRRNNIMDTPVVSAFQALRRVARSTPRALPWAGMLCPFGAEETKTAQLQKAPAKGSGWQYPL